MFSKVSQWLKASAQGQDNSFGDEDSAGIANIDITDIITIIVILAGWQHQGMSKQASNSAAAYTWFTIVI